MSTLLLVPSHGIFLLAWRSWQLLTKSTCLGLLQEAKKLAQESCEVAHGKPDWQQLFQNELSLISDLMIVYDRERQVVYFQAIAQHLSKLPQGKVLVKSAKFEPLQLQHELG